MKKQRQEVLWLSRHTLSPAQEQAIRDLHGEDAAIGHIAHTFESEAGLFEYIQNHPGLFIYAVAGAVHYVSAALAGARFGVFVNHPQKRQDGTFGLASVYWVNRSYSGKIQKVWQNPDPLSDTGEALVPVLRQ